MFEAQRCGGQSMLDGATSKSDFPQNGLLSREDKVRGSQLSSNIGVLRLEEVSLQASPIVFSFKCPFAWPRDSFQLMSNMLLTVKTIIGTRRKSPRQKHILRWC